MFICSSLEPGKDGVGDYTRRLASELIRLGHPCAAIALHDKHIFKKVDEKQYSENIDFPILRMPAKMAAKERFKQAKSYVDKFNPECLSLQFVIFGYHPKGLPFNMGKQLANLGKGRRWHIMFHELWIGMAKESPIKQQFWGMAQKGIIKRLIKKLKPAVIHTQCELYKIKLEQIGFRVDILSLFSGIPKVAKPATSSIPSVEKNQISMAIFGTIHPDAPIDEFATEMANYANSNNIAFKIIFIGRCGEEQMKWLNVFGKRGISTEVIGEQPTEVISEILSNANYGISTTTFAMTDKSGTVAAMREHGLPIICVSHPYTPVGIDFLPPPVGVLEFKKGNFKTCFNGREIFTSVNNPNKTSKILLQSFGETMGSHLNNY